MRGFFGLSLLGRSQTSRVRRGISLIMYQWAVVCLSVLATTSALAGSTLDRVNSTKTLNDVVLDYYPPFGFINDHNELAGFDVDVARALAIRLGLKLKLSTPGWEAVVAGGWRGRWDVCICSMSPTAQRARS